MRPAHPLQPLDEEREAFEVLHAEVDGQTGNVPARLVTLHLLDVTRGGDFPLRRAALEALVRRIKAARASSEDWRIEGHRKARLRPGAYRVVVSPRKRYRLLISSFDDLSGSCECPDFARSSLGLCKHLWWALEQGFDQTGKAASTSELPSPLTWDAVRPLTGAGDWLERVRWADGALPRDLASAFTRQGRPQQGVLASPPRRLALVRSLIAIGHSSTRPPEPALAGLLHREETSLARQADETPSATEVRRALARLHRPLFPYQEEGVLRFLGAGRLLLADDMGLGKTAQAIAACHVLHETGRVTRGLIIVPAALKVQWHREWTLFTSVPAAIVDGLPAARARQYREAKSGFLIVSYEQVLKDLPLLARLAPELVVLDEAQRIKNWATKTALSVKQLQPGWRLVLTGTPFENRLTELASLMDWVDDLALEPKWRLTEWHTVRADGVRDVIGAKNLDTIRCRIAPHALRRVRQEVLRQLPPRTDTRVPVPLTTEQAGAHGELDQPIAKLVRVAEVRPLTQPEFLRLMSLMTQQRIICNGLGQRDFEEIWPTLLRTGRPTEAALRGLFSPKLLEFRELISNLVVTQRRKVVVFSQWKRMLHLAQWAISDLLSDSSLRAVRFTGEESQKRRTQNIVDFHDDERTRVFFSTDAGGVGLNLQRAASACIHLELPWNPANLEQRASRIFRLGQTRPVEIYALVSSSGIESRIASIVSGKKALFDGVFDGLSDAVRFEKGGAFMATLQRVLEPVVAPESADDDDLQDPPGDVSDVVAPSESAPPSPSIDFMAGIKVQRMEDGRMVLEARPEAAAAFASVLEGVAAMLRQLAPP